MIITTVLIDNLRKHVVNFPVNVSASDIVECRNYVIENQWNICYRLASNGVKRAYGVYERLHTILRFRPATTDDLFRAVPRAGVTVVNMSAEEFRRLAKAMLLMVSRLVPEKNLLMYSTEDGFEVMIYNRPYRLIGYSVGRLRRMILFSIPSAPDRIVREVESTINKYGDSVDAGDYIITLETGVIGLSTSRVTPRVSAYLYRVKDIDSGVVTLEHLDGSSVTVSIPVTTSFLVALIKRA